jgi:Alpha/beta hydrolase domain
LRSPDILVPRATYTGWNLRAEGYSRRAMYSIVGRYLPFAADAEARRDSGNPRPALTERYRSKAYYVRQVALAVQALIEAGVLLEEDADRYLDAAMRVKR